MSWRRYKEVRPPPAKEGAPPTAYWQRQRISMRRGYYSMFCRIWQGVGSAPKGGGILPSRAAPVPPSPIPFVPSGHFPLIRGIGLSQGGLLVQENSPPCERGDTAEGGGGIPGRWGQQPLHQVTIALVGAAISRPPSQSRLRRASSPKGGAKNTPSTLPLAFPLGAGRLF